jgi:hypothetical protein
MEAMVVDRKGQGKMSREDVRVMMHAAIGLTGRVTRDDPLRWRQLGLAGHWSRRLEGDVGGEEDA